MFVFQRQLCEDASFLQRELLQCQEGSISNKNEDYHSINHIKFRYFES